MFYGGGWLQVSGALLSIVFFLVLLQLSGARGTLAGSATATGCALLLSVVVIGLGPDDGAYLAVAPGFRKTSKAGRHRGAVARRLRDRLAG